MKDIIRDTQDRSPEEIIQKALTSVREHLGMEIAYLSEIVENDSVFRAVDAPGLEALIKPGDSRSLDDVYCNHILEGRLPSLIPDTAAFPLAASMPITTAAPIGAHVSVPIRRNDGSVYGMFCCLSPTPNPTLNERDLSIMETFAGLCADQLNGAISERVKREQTTTSIRQMLELLEFEMVYQPIHHLDSDRPSGYEALCRFRSEPYQTPDLWFAEAATVGLGVDLELAAISEGLKALSSLPDDLYVSVNAAPATIASGRLGEVFDGQPLGRVVLEVTEHDAIEDLDCMLTELKIWRAQGLILAIDDAGAGHSGLQQIVRLSPDMLKLDRSLTSGIDGDPIKRSLAAAMVHFAGEQGAVIVAEGIENAAELKTLRKIGVHRGQGWFLGRPTPLADVV